MPPFKIGLLRKFQKPFKVGRALVHRAACSYPLTLKYGPCPHQHLTDKFRVNTRVLNTQAPLCRMLLSVCMKDYVARSYGHTPRKLPLKSVPLRATSRFIAYQAEIIILYLSPFVKKNFSIYNKKYNKIFNKVSASFLCILTNAINPPTSAPDRISRRIKTPPKAPHAINI